ncbi:histone-lysine N-methyltransferase, H3 lysine-79 specific isoform X2 [Drosophila takahashii]|uniref:histone-lysine N-methyltransferase, H3 lysine-79 specific isoform X2 n=1 Tax=Drosophila takahashii TaxID=29030 RepID=UPI003899129F
MSHKNTKGFKGIFKKMYRQKSYVMESPQTPKTEKERSQDRKEREQERKEREKERKKEQELERKREQERRKEVEREKQQERQRQLEWKKELERERQREKELDHPRQETSSVAKKPNPEISKFDDEFERDIENLERQICHLDFRSKTMATMWMDKLRQTPQNVAEARSRNIITSHILKCCGESIFKKEPFNHPPPPENLTTIRERMYLTRDSTCHGMPVAKQREPNSYLTQLFNDSYDGGEFLSQLPVPRDGAFFILHMRPNL